VRPLAGRLSRDAGAEHSLSLWEALEEELVALAGALPDSFLSEKSRYLALRRAADDALQADPRRMNAAVRAAEEARDLAERTYVKQLFEVMHDRKRTALCFSGGGIRSATFGLGVVQALAHYSTNAARQAPPTLLGEFDYVSTVSGGGYLGGWLSAWRHWHPQGIRGVIEALGATPLDKLDPEPGTLRHLRNYTAYLTPRTGLLSADTWTLIATYLRNIFLNWLVLLPLVAAVLMIPVLTNAIMGLGRDVPFVPGGTPLRLLLAGGFICIVIPTAYVARVLPSFGDRPGTQPQYFAGVLVPLCVGASLLSTYWAWYIHSYQEPHTIGTFIRVGAAAHLTGAMLGAILVVTQRRVHRLGLITASIVVTWMLWRYLGYGAAFLMVPVGLTALYRQYALKIISIFAAALLTGALGGALGYLAATTFLNPAVASSRLYTLLSFPFLLAVFGLITMLAVATTSRFTLDDDREWWARSGAWILIVVLAWLAFSAAVLYGPDLLRRLVAALAAAGGVTGIVVSRLGSSGKTTAGRREDQPTSRSDEDWSTVVGRYILKLAAPTFIVLLILLIAIFNDWLLKALPLWLRAALPDGVSRIVTRPVRLELAMTALLLIPAFSLAWLININIFSLHGMYRSRLIRAFLGASNPARRPNPFTGFDRRDNIPMAEIGREKTGKTPVERRPIERPLHVVNIALNLVKGENLAWQQRKAESFTVTPLHAGSCRVGYRPTADYGGFGGIDIGTAITISGAAASPNQGYHSSPIVTLLMALFNARLGWWLANPGRHGRGLWQLSSPRWAVTPWVQEGFGLSPDTARWVYLCDGRHLEDLGLYEMVLRRCRLIVVVDASADPDYTLEDLGNAVRKVRVDFGIPIEFPDGIRIRARMDRANAHCAVGRIQYRCVDGAVTQAGTRIKDGILVYIKPAMNGNEPPDVTHYASVDPQFPQQPTSDQFFDEAQFESYRRLGSHVVDELLGPDRPCSLREFVGRAMRQSRAAARAPA
jgi:hypothetical protein